MDTIAAPSGARSMRQRSFCRAGSAAGETESRARNASVQAVRVMGVEDGGRGIAGPGFCRPKNWWRFRDITTFKCLGALLNPQNRDKSPRQLPRPLTAPKLFYTSWLAPKNGRNRPLHA